MYINIQASFGTSRNTKEIENKNKSKKFFQTAQRIRENRQTICYKFPCRIIIISIIDSIVIERINKIIISEIEFYVCLCKFKNIKA